jgi:glycosyltransferase involved in cell wall biosynthesis
MKSAVIYLGVFPPVKGASGGDRRVRDITIGISNHSIKTTMIVPKWQDKGIRNQDSKYFDIKYVGSIFNRVPVLNRLFFWINATLFLWKEKYNISLMYYTTIDSLPFILILRLLGIKIGFEISDLNAPELTGLIRWHALLIENFIPKFTNLNVGISDFICSHFKRVAPNVKTIKIPILADPETFVFSEASRKDYRSKKGLSDDDILVVYAGGTWKAEGVAVLMEAVKTIQQNLSNIHLIVAGRAVKNDDRFDDIEAISATMDAKRVILTGWIATDELLSIYCAADILVVPQLKNNFNKAALPTKLAEYSAMGKAILLSDVGDVNLYFKNNDNAVVMEDSTVDNIIDSLSSLSKNEHLRKAIGMNAKITAETTLNRSKAGLDITKNLI